MSILLGTLMKGRSQAFLSGGEWGIMVELKGRDFPTHLPSQNSLQAPQLPAKDFVGVSLGQQE